MLAALFVFMLVTGTILGSQGGIRAATGGAGGNGLRERPR